MKNFLLGFFQFFLICWFLTVGGEIEKYEPYCDTNSGIIFLFLIIGIIMQMILIISIIYKNGD